ncbi:3-hydroxybutyrate dehydrogenase/3-oxoacyl-[acyl-carrier protein] reductase [Nocardioides daedukensis]|uniref:3-hydroxybutyrate dehydrogenase/3-oxoacyl-[acyl-carrier protein] reductase n=1 Tax=Nocardioides daedukensis TaxID=634462 RepID=A0A7Y9S2X5_9ACTN|nr:SDR family NAD(P)-dependent oxidoreductase [Nocardioides daedukensis]NYG59552.1 3-hydroxybutyrate dehydrogenase/3-oxoacyl-[acyl-carrier protein] reductase [Nocardioides daedukensis]
MGTLDGKVALVTAGTRGIGRGIAEALLAQGASVVMTGRSPEKGAKALAEIGLTDRTAFLAGDARDKDEVAGWVAGAVERFGRLDILVNNAGGSDGFALVHELSDEAWDNAFTFIVDSAFWATRAALPVMLEQGSGRVVNISSVEGKMGNKAAVSHYISAKHAMNGFTKAVAFEYGQQGITSNAICPGAIETDLMVEVGPSFAAETGVTYEEYKADYAKDAAIGRLNTVEEVGAMAVLLAGPAGGGITGALLNVDGGTSPF